MTSTIQIAVSQRCFPGMDAEEAATRAASIGFDGIVLDTPVPAALPIAAVSTTAGLTGTRRSDETAAVIRRLVEQAAAIECGIVQLPDVAVGQPFDRSLSPLVIGDWLSTLADHAAEHGAILAVVNGPVVRTAKMMWNLLERANHPAIACCWDVDSAIRWGETPGISVPVLGSRIVAARLGRIGEQGKLFLARLRGIGFTGWVTVNDSSIATAEALAVIRGELKPKAAAKMLPKKAVAKV